MRQIFGMLVALAITAFFFSPAQAGGEANCVVSVQCNAYHSGGHGLKPAVPDMVCFTFTQKHPDFVVFTLYDVLVNPDNLSDPANHISYGPIKHEKMDGMNGQFCVGHQRVEGAVFVVLCNQNDAHSYRDLPDLQEGLKSGTVAMCLNGDATCAHFVS